ncbi:hypothetical protein EVAR_32458_1 [Eumeta japonica]|uniref:Uncharacterized protein n=1 Tax=Eumeta variegata TaxID=151549 RepID=A0A4C1VNS4_EUMVA|nr:hypothetical protein EVAR_32458_1 [Eumeta japonica]
MLQFSFAFAVLCRKRTRRIPRLNAVAEIENEKVTAPTPFDHIYAERLHESVNILSTVTPGAMSTDDLVTSDVKPHRAHLAEKLRDYISYGPYHHYRRGAEKTL